MQCNGVLSWSVVGGHVIPDGGQRLPKYLYIIKCFVDIILDVYVQSFKGKANICFFDPSGSWLVFIYVLHIICICIYIFIYTINLYIPFFSIQQFMLYFAFFQWNFYSFYFLFFIYNNLLISFIFAECFSY